MQREMKVLQRSRNGLRKRRPAEGGCVMKGYFTKEGYMGFVNGKYMLFASESDYREYMEEEEDA